MASKSLSPRRLKTLHPLTRNDMRKLAQLGREIHYTQGCYIFRENDKGDSLFLLLAGNVQVLKSIRGKGQVALRVLKPGEIFGEMSLFTGRRRTAACQTLSPSIVLEIPHAGFRKLLRDGDVTATKLIQLNCNILADRLSHVLDLIGHDNFATSSENPVFRRMKFFWAV